MLWIDRDNNIRLTRGDTAIISLEVQRNGQSYDYSNDLVQLTVKKNTVTTDVVFQKEISGTSFTIDPSDTSELDYQNLKYDVQVTTQGGEVFTVIPPRNFTITEEVTFDVEP